MKKFTLIAFLSILGSILSTNMNAQNKNISEEAIKNLKAYPETVKNLQRHVIFLEAKDNEDLYKVELIAGKNMEVDCNNHRLIGKFEDETVSGWGFNYFEFETEGKVVSTMMACNKPKEMKFVSGETEITRYNSRLPIVVYLPKDMQLKYKIWSAGEEFTGEKK